MNFPTTPPPAPPPPPKVSIPSPDDPELIAARRQRLEQFDARQGRASTELADRAPTYSRTTLG